MSARNASGLAANSAIRASKTGFVSSSDASCATSTASAISSAVKFALLPVALSAFRSLRVSMARVDIPRSYRPDQYSVIGASVETPAVALHAAPILPSHVEQRVRDLTERTHAHRVHQLLEHVSVVDHHLLQSRKRGRRFVRMPRVEVGEALQLRLLLLVGRARELELPRRRVFVRIAERVDADDRIRAVVLAMLVVQR